MSILHILEIHVVRNEMIINLPKSVNYQQLAMDVASLVGLLTVEWLQVVDMRLAIDSVN